MKCICDDNVIHVQLYSISVMNCSTGRHSLNEGV